MNKIKGVLIICLILLLLCGCALFKGWELEEIEIMGDDEPLIINEVVR